MIPFLSRHIPTAAQQATVNERFGTLVCPVAPTFERGDVDRCVSIAVARCLAQDADREQYSSEEDVILSHWPIGAADRVVAGVFPAWAVLELLRSGWTVVEFQSEPSARLRGVFVCRGAFVHTHATSEFLACPIPAHEQETSPLLERYHGR